MQYPQTRYQDTIASGISNSALSVTAGTTPPTRTQGVLTIGRLQSNTEDVFFNGIAGNVVTLTLRGLSQTALTPTEVSGNKKVHNASESLEFTTHHLYDTNKVRLDENETISGVKTFSVSQVFSVAPRLPGFLDASGNESIDTPATASAINHLSVQNAAAGGNVIVTTVGDDTNVNLELKAKGTGIVILEDGAETKTSAAPTTNAGIANKLYVDTQIGGVTDIKVKVSAADTTADYLSAKLAFGTHLSATITTPGGNEDYTISTDAIQSSAGAADANKLVATGSNGTIDPSLMPGLSLTTLEAIDGSSTPQFVAYGSANMKSSVKIYYTNGVFTLSGTDRPVGDVDAKSRLGQSFVMTDSFAASIAANDVTIFLKKVGAPTDNFTCEIQADSAGAPSGTAITNGTSANVTGASLSTSYKPQKLTWATPPTLTSGTTYWLVFKRSTASDAANYFVVLDAGGNTYSGGSAATYTASTLTWSAIANDIQLQLVLNVSYGGKVCKCDADNTLRSNGIGFITANIGSGASASIVQDRIITYSGLTDGSSYVASTTAGGLLVDSSSPMSANIDTSTPHVVAGRYYSGNQFRVGGAKRLFLEGVSGIGNGSNCLKLYETFSAVAGISFDVLVPVGFRPDEITIWATYDDNSATIPGSSFCKKYAGLTRISTVYVRGSGFNATMTGNVIDTGAASGNFYGQGTYSANNSIDALVQLIAIYDNAVLIRVTLDATADKVVVQALEFLKY